MVTSLDSSAVLNASHLVIGLLTLSLFLLSHALCPDSAPPEPFASLITASINRNRTWCFPRSLDPRLAQLERR
ncbi:hypothetical protein BDM02DRAFT_3114122 [Thelephora ganbajun]|uniref:Uncharacterized protein n=1 Tax=Thelephora ganbajun TaxID=370292 RepID=A0ACB6ZHP7_THEGA|nr:hypothetical protein BDM02DRAFT_3114122 [Thelephora ganbajun]